MARQPSQRRSAPWAGYNYAVPKEPEISDDLWRAGRATWPGVEVPRALFAAYVRERIGAGTLDGLCTTDLYLTCACVHDAKGAVATFDRTFLARVPEMVRQIDRSPAFADDVCQHLREKLLLPAGRPKLAAYTGRGALGSWVRVAALRTALNLRDVRQPGQTEPLEDHLLVAPGGDDAELEYLRRRYRDEFQTAVRAALDGLPRERRRLLRLHVVTGLSTAQLGTALGVNQSTIVRWLAAARDQLREEIHRGLAQRLGLSGPELESLTGLILSRLDLSVTSALAATDPG